MDAPVSAPICAPSVHLSPPEDTNRAAATFNEPSEGVRVASGEARSHPEPIRFFISRPYSGK
jgi:hypothetical protein